MKIWTPVALEYEILLFKTSYSSERVIWSRQMTLGECIQFCGEALFLGPGFDFERWVLKASKPVTHVWRIHQPLFPFVSYNFETVLISSGLN